jgi:hypothetical protein
LYAKPRNVSKCKGTIQEIFGVKKFVHICRNLGTVKDKP